MKDYRIKLGCRLALKRFDPDDTGMYNKNEDGKAKAKAAAAELIAKLDQLQERLICDCRVRYNCAADAAFFPIRTVTMRSSGNENTSSSVSSSPTYRAAGLRS